MIPASRSAWIFCACLTLLLAGCNSSVNYEKTGNLEPGVVRPFVVDGPRREQKVTITFKSSESPVDVHVALGNDIDAVTSAITNFKTPQNVLASKLKAHEGSLEVTVPAKTPFAAIVSGAIRDTSLQVTIKGK